MLNGSITQLYKIFYLFKVQNWMIVYNTRSRAGTNLTWEQLVNHCFSDFQEKRSNVAKVVWGPSRLIYPGSCIDQAMASTNPCHS